MSDYNLHGTCSLCGGPVVTWMFYSGEQIPHCKNCGATMKNPFSKKIEMEPSKVITDTKILVEK